MSGEPASDGDPTKTIVVAVGTGLVALYAYRTYSYAKRRLTPWHFPEGGALQLVNMTEGDAAQVAAGFLPWLGPLRSIEAAEVMIMPDDTVHTVDAAVRSEARQAFAQLGDAGPCVCMRTTVAVRGESDVDALLTPTALASAAPGAPMSVTTAVAVCWGAAADASEVYEVTVQGRLCADAKRLEQLAACAVTFEDVFEPDDCAGLWSESERQWMSLSHAWEVSSGSTYAARWTAANVARLEGRLDGAAVAGLVARPWRYRAVLAAAHDAFYGEQVRLNSSWAGATGRGLVDAARSIGSSVGLQGLVRRLGRISRRGEEPSSRSTQPAVDTADTGAFGTGAFARDFGFSDSDPHSGVYTGEVTVHVEADRLPYLRRLADAFHLAVSSCGDGISSTLELKMRGDVLRCTQGMIDMALHLQLHGFRIERLRLKLQLLKGASAVSFPAPPLRLPQQVADSRYLSALQHYEVVVVAAAPIDGLEAAFPHSAVDAKAPHVGRACFRDISYNDAATGAEDFFQAVAARAGVKHVDAFVVVYDTCAP